MKEMLTNYLVHTAASVLRVSLATGNWVLGFVQRDDSKLTSTTAQGSCGEGASAVCVYQGAPASPYQGRVTGQGRTGASHESVERAQRRSMASSPLCPGFRYTAQPNHQSRCKCIFQWAACEVGLIAANVSHLLCFLVISYLWGSPLDFNLCVFGLSSEMRCFALGSLYKSFQSLSRYASERESYLVKTVLIPI